MYKEAFDYILSFQNIAIISHINPDGDALGSSLAIYPILQKLKKDVTVVNLTQDIDKSLDFLPNFNKIKSKLPNRVELIISCDCGSFDRLGIKKDDFKILNIDHHITNTNFGDFNLVFPNEPSTSVVIYKLLKVANIDILKESAICIYTGLVVDTGFFQFENVNKETFLIASELVELGVSPNCISTMLNQRLPLSKVRITSQILSTLELFFEAKVSMIYVNQKMLRESGSTKSETEDIANVARNLVTVKIAIFLREEENGDIKVSLRSKKDIEVDTIALHFGGGGHKRASGFVLKGLSLEDAKKNILDFLEDKFFAKNRELL